MIKNGKVKDTMFYEEYILNRPIKIGTISDSYRSISYENLYEEVIFVYQKLKENGICGFDIVGVFFDNRIEFITCMLAINMIGAQAMPIYAQTGMEKVKRISEIYSWQCIVSHKCDIDRYIRKEFCRKRISNGLYMYIQNVSQDKQNYEGAILLLTSGTTNNPKCVVLTNDNIIASIKNISNFLQFTPSDRILIMKNVVHISTLVGEIFVGLFFGSSLYLTNRLVVGSYIERIILLERITAMFVTPSLMRMLLPSLKKALYQLHHIHISGEVLPVTLVKEILSLSPTIRLCSGYGLTEASPRVTQIEGWDILAHPGAVGKPIGDQIVRIVNGNGQECINNEEGEVLVKGKNVMRGYLSGGDLLLLKDGWLHTGDCGHIDNDGYLYIHGRMDNMIIINGRNVYPEEIEEVIGTYPGVREVMVGRMMLGNRSVLCAQIVSDISLKSQEILEYCRNYLEDYKVPTKVCFVESIPKTMTGKIVRRNL